MTLPSSSTSSTDHSNRYVVGPHGARSLPPETPPVQATTPPPTANAARASGLGAPAQTARQGTRLSPLGTVYASGADETEDRWGSTGMVRGPVPPEELARLGGLAQGTIADPVPLGLAGFAAATFTISTAYCGWFGVPSAAVAIPIALIFGGIGQFLAGMWAFRRGNVLAATAFSTFGCFNMSWALLNWLELVHVLPTFGIASGPAYVEGIFVLMFALIATYLGIAALGENRMIAAILFVLAFTYLCDGTGVWIGGANWLLAIGGYAGIIVSLMAFYESAAVVINSSFQREVLPTYPVRDSAPLAALAARLRSSLQSRTEPRQPMLPNAPTPA